MSDYVYANGELYHYGVKGMKWGVRRAQKKERKLQKRRESYVYKTQRKIHNNERDLDRETRRLKALEIEGMDSDRVKARSKEIAREHADRAADRIDFYSGKTTSEQSRQATADFDYLFNSDKYKKLAYADLVKDHNKAISRYESQTKKWMAANEAVMNMPIDSTKKEYRQAIRRAKSLVD